MPRINTVWNEIFAVVRVAYPTFFRVSGEKHDFAPTIENAKFIGVDEGVSADGRAEYFVSVVGIRGEAVGYEDDDFI